MVIETKDNELIFNPVRVYKILDGGELSQLMCQDVNGESHLIAESKYAYVVCDVYCFMIEFFNNPDNRVLTQCDIRENCGGAL